MQLTNWASKHRHTEKDRHEIFHITKQYELPFRQKTKTLLPETNKCFPIPKTVGVCVYPLVVIKS